MMKSVQQRYGELIVAYYASGLTDQGVFSFQNLYLYGGLFDIIAVVLSHLVPIDPYDLRHILCALVGIGGIGAAAATARLIAGPRAALIAAAGLSVTGAWYGAMFNHTKDIPFAAAMTGATFVLIRIARRLPSPRAGDLAAFGLLAGAALGIRVLGLLLVIYAGFAIALYLPRPRLALDRVRRRFLIESSLRLLPALMLAYGIMILAWPWAATGAAQSAPGPACILRISLRDPHRPRRPGLRDGGRAAAVCADLLSDPRAAADSDRCGTGDAVGAVTAARRSFQATAWQRCYPGVADRNFSADLPGDRSRPRFHRIAPFPVRASGAGDPRGHRSRRGLVGACRAQSPGRIRRACDRDSMFPLGCGDPGRLHPYEYLFYNPPVGGLQGASRRYDLDYWFSSMPEALSSSKPICAAPRPSRRTGRRRSIRSPCAASASRSRRTSRSRNCTWTSSRVGTVRVLHRADPYELRQRSRRRGHRHRRTAWRRHRIHQGPSGTDPARDRGRGERAGTATRKIDKIAWPELRRGCRPAFRSLLVLCFMAIRVADLHFCRRPACTRCTAMPRRSSSGFRKSTTKCRPRPAEISVSTKYPDESQEHADAENLQRILPAQDHRPQPRRFQSRPARRHEAHGNDRQRQEMREPEHVEIGLADRINPLLDPVRK